MKNENVLIILVFGAIFHERKVLSSKKRRIESVSEEIFLQEKLFNVEFLWLIFIRRKWIPK